jgi:hypothetical protein
MSAHIAMQCASGVLNSALRENNTIPAFGLAIDLHATGVPLCVSTVFELALALPGSFQLGPLAATTTLMCSTFYDPAVSMQEGACRSLSQQLCSLSSAVAVPDTGVLARAPQGIDHETRRMLDQVATSPSTFLPLAVSSLTLCGRFYGRRLLRTVAPTAWMRRLTIFFGIVYLKHALIMDGSRGTVGSMETPFAKPKEEKMGEEFAS